MCACVVQARYFKPTRRSDIMPVPDKGLPAPSTGVLIMNTGLFLKRFPLYLQQFLELLNTHLVRVCVFVLILPLITSCTIPEEWLPGVAPEKPLTLENIQLATPAAIALDFELATPEAIAPQLEVAMFPQADDGQREDMATSSPMPETETTRTETVTATATMSATNTVTATATISPTVSATTVTIWPTWTSAPTSTRTASPVPTKTNTRAPSTEPPQSPTTTATGTDAPAGDPPPAPTATHTLAPTNTSAPSGCSPDGSSVYETTLIGLINEAREARGLQPLKQQNQLTAAARVHSNDMACNDFISHTGSDGSRPADRVTAQGYLYSWVGENIFAGSSGPQTAFDWWMDSEPHRNNILHSNYTEIGIGYSYLEGSRYRSHYTAVFARPR